ncbi:MAG TPA: M20 family metallo-hydrolase, partial [Elusimicrobiales bacterium]|nr:M20 family metallo-hydrolase [Elusimicrobiales bacterium]
MQKNIFKKIESYLDYAVELETNLTAIPAVDPSSGGDGEFEKANYLESELKKLKFDEILRIDAPDKRVKSKVRPNIVARYKGQNSSKTFWIMTHLDIVPPGDLKLWKTDPYKLLREGNKIYGRGTEDNQQGLVASILAVKAMMETGYRPPVDIVLLFIADEEVGEGYGIDYLLKNKNELFGKKDIFLTPDGGNARGNAISVSEKSLIWLKFIVTGKQCHASTPHVGINPVTASSKLMCKLEEKLREKYNAKDKLFNPPISTFVPTKREVAKVSINTI